MNPPNNILRTSLAAIKARYHMKVLAMILFTIGYGTLFYLNWKIATAVLIINIGGGIRIQ